MGSGFLQHFTTLFLFYLFLCPGSSVAETPPQEAIWKSRIAGNHENDIPFSSSVFTTRLDNPGTVPIVNPTSPATTTPIDTPPAPTSGTTIPDTPPAPPAGTTIPDTPPAPPAGTTIPNTPPAPTAGTTTPPSPATTTPTTNPTPTSSGGQWCIASPTASETALQVALDYACGYGGADCSAIQSGASCYNPNTVRDHASYAFNEYYQKNPTPTSCAFGGTAQLTSTDPSNGNCHYASPNSTPSVTPPANPTPMPTTTTPTTMTPPMTTTPGGPTIFGVAEPTGSPNSATSVSCSILLLCITAIVGSLLAANQF